MNRGAFQSSLVQQMMGGSPSWWNMNNLRLPSELSSPLLPSSSPSSSSSSSLVLPQHPQPSHLVPTTQWNDNQDLPESWSQLLLGGLVEEEDRCSFPPFQAKKMENWENQVLYPSAGEHMVDVKQETSENGFVCGRGNEEIHLAKSSWNQILPANSPSSCITTSFSSNMLDFSNSTAEGRHHQPDHSSEGNNSAFKKARVQASSGQPTFKVRKEKLGDRITALHQLVSPFGKTDTASVLLEAIGYIRFLQSQIEALSSPYLDVGSGNMKQPRLVFQAQGERSSIFPEDPGQLLNDASAKKRGTPDQDANNEPKRDLRSRGLCLVPVSCTMPFGSDNGADYWASTLGGGF